MLQSVSLRCLIGIVLLCGSNVVAEPLRYKIESNHSTIGFSVPIFGGLSRVSGKFTDVEVEIIFDEEDLEASSVSAVMQVSGIDTGIGMRDQDLQNEIFFNAQIHPEIRFISEGVSRKSDGIYETRGNFTMRGVTREVVLPFELKVHRLDDGGRILGVKMRTELNRLDFGVGQGWKHTSMENFLGDKIAVEIDLWTRTGKPIE